MFWLEKKFLKNRGVFKDKIKIDFGELQLAINNKKFYGAGFRINGIACEACPELGSGFTHSLVRLFL
jgi:hypothetical protein